MGWKYATGRAKGTDWVSHQLGDSACIASAQTARFCFLDKQFNSEGNFGLQESISKGK